MFVCLDRLIIACNRVAFIFFSFKSSRKNIPLSWNSWGCFNSFTDSYGWFDIETVSRCFFFNSLVIFKIRFGRKIDFPHSPGPEIIQRIRWVGYRNFSLVFYHLLFVYSLCILLKLWEILIVCLLGLKVVNIRFWY